MLTTEEKKNIEEVLEKKLGVDSQIVKNLNSHILLNVKQILVNYREEYLKADSKIYEERADKLARQLQNILATSIKNFDTKTEVLRETMGEIAENTVHSVVNGKLDKIATNVNDMKKCMYILADDIVSTRKKTIYFAFLNGLDRSPLRTIFFTVLFSGFVIGTVLQTYNIIQLDLIQIVRSIVKFFV